MGFWEEDGAGWQTGARTPPLLGDGLLRARLRGRAKARTTNLELQPDGACGFLDALSSPRCGPCLWRDV